MGEESDDEDEDGGFADADDDDEDGQVRSPTYVLCPALPYCTISRGTVLSLLEPQSHVGDKLLRI